MCSFNPIKLSSYPEWGQARIKCTDLNDPGHHVGVENSSDWEFVRDLLLCPDYIKLCNPIPIHFLSVLNLLQLKQLFTCTMLNICANPNSQGIVNCALTKPHVASSGCITRGPKKTSMRRGGRSTSQPIVWEIQKMFLLFSSCLCLLSQICMCYTARCETWICFRTSEIFFPDISSINKFFMKFFSCLAFQRRDDESQVSEASCSW